MTATSMTIGGDAPAPAAAANGGDDHPFDTLPPVEHHPEARFEPFPLTGTQQAYRVGRGDAGELGSGYWEWEAHALDVARLRTAWSRVLDRHDMLRAVIDPDGSLRIPAEPPEYEIPVLDLREHEAGAAEDETAKLRDHLSHHVAPAGTGPLWDVRLTLLPAGRTRIHLRLDPLIIDAWSAWNILVPDLAGFYTDPQARPAPPELSFRDYALAADAALEQSEVFRRSRRYWLDRLTEGLPDAPDLPRAPSGADLANVRFTRRQHRLDAATWARLKERAQAAGITPTGVVVAAYAEVLRAWSGNDRFTLNLPVVTRLPLHRDVDALIGDFTTTSLLAVEQADGTFAERARSIQERISEDLEHRYFNGVQVARELARRSGGTTAAAFPVAVTSLLGQPPRPFVTALGEVVHTSTRTPQATLDLQAGEVAGALHLSWDSLDEVFPPGMPADMFQAYRGLLDTLAGDAVSWRNERFPLVPVEQLRVREEVNRTDGEIPDLLLHTPVATHAAQRPDAPAVISGDVRLTYRELDHRVNQIGRRLRADGARPETLVAIVSEKGWEQIVAAHGILAAGAAYLPIDADVPAERLHYLLAHGNVDTVLTQSAVDGRVDWPDSVRRLLIDGDFDDVDPGPLEPAQEAGNLAYVIYTSGSTGRPKGVMVDHRGAANTILDMNRRLGIGPDDRCLAVSGLHFDLSVYDVFGMIAAGGTVVVPPRSPNPEPARWAELIRDEGITFWNSVPALMEILVSQAEGAGESLAPLDAVVLAGDWIPVTLPDRLRQLAPGVRVIGSGGPTETCVWSVVYPIGAVDPAWPSIPYGRPMTNQRYHVLDARREHRPVWVPGEIYIESRVGLARGYWRDEERTAAQFVPHPATGGRMYASGDLGRYLPDGTIEILGRTDFQVKIQGHRIELGEIEAVLAEHPSIARAVVVASGATPQTRRLVAYVTADGAEPDTRELTGFLAGRLPRYMVPGTIRVLDTLPLTGNGKVDRLALASSTGPRDDSREVRRRPELSSDYAVPDSEMETAVAEIWAGLLGLDEVGVDDDFFELGGHSLLAVQIAGEIAARWAVVISPRDFYLNPTVAELAATIEQERA